MKISARAHSIDTSGIRKVFDLIASMNDPINLSIGQPYYDALDEVKEGTHRAIDQGRSRYTVTQGITELREEILQSYGTDSGKAHDVLITSGASGGFLLGYMAILDPGDEILVPDPFFGMYRDVARLLNAVPVFYDLYPSFRLPVEKIEPLITPRTKAIVVNNPGNPTGIAFDESELAALIDVAKKHNIWIIYDEIYSAFSLDHPHVNILGRYDWTLIVSGFSKSFGIPGWRIGYSVGPKVIIKEMVKLQQYTFVCAPSLVQYGALAGLKVNLSEKAGEYRKKRDFAYDNLKVKFPMTKPSGAFYMFPKAPGGVSQKFVERCLEKQLLVVPGHVFSARDTHFRISFSASWDDLERGVEILNNLADEF